MLATACMFQFPFGLTADMKQRLATRHRWVWIKMASEVLAAPADLRGPAHFNAVAALAAELKAINPRVKVGMYAGGIASPDSHHPSFEWLVDDDDLLHYSPSQPLSVSPSQSPAEPGSRRYKVINYARAETRAKLVAKWRAFLAEHGLDGVVFDTMVPAYYASWMQQLGLPNGSIEGACHTEIWWFAALATFAWQVRWALAEDGRDVWTNGLLDFPFDPTNPNHQLIGKGFTGLSVYSSGQLAEYAHTMYRSPADLRGSVELAALVNERSRGAFWWVQPRSFEVSGQPYPWTDGPELQRFYLACYLLLANPPYTLFGYHPGPSYQAYHLVHGTPEPYLFDGGQDWDQEYGAATGGVTWNGDVAWREYTNGYAAVNAGDSYGYLPLPADTYRDWHPQLGGLVEITSASPGLNVPPKTGLFLFRGAA